MTLGHSGAHDWAPECPSVKKIEKGGLDQYGAEHFCRLIFATIRKKRVTDRGGSKGEGREAAATCEKRGPLWSPIGPK